MKTFIKSNLSRKRRLPIVGNEIVTIYSFGQSTPHTQRKNKVTFHLRSIYDDRVKIKFEALKTGVISETVINSPGKESVNMCKNKGIELSDSLGYENNDEEISLLIESDMYWKLITGKIKRISDILVASETRLGWAISDTESAETSSVLSILHNAVHVNNKPDDKTWELINVEVRSFRNR